jgi:hypothetical protein
MELVLYQDDLDEEDRIDDLVCVAIAVFDADKDRWTAVELGAPVHLSALDDRDRTLYDNARGRRTGARDEGMVVEGLHPGRADRS